MNGKKILNYFFAIVFFLMTIHFLTSDLPHKYLLAAIVFLSSVQGLLNANENDYRRRLSRRLSTFGLILTLILLVKMLFSI